MRGWMLFRVPVVLMLALLALLPSSATSSPLSRPWIPRTADRKSVV